MRALDVTLAGRSLTLRIPVPSRSARLVQGVIDAKDPEASELAGVSVLCATAVDWPWSREAPEAWPAMWDDGVGLHDVHEAVRAWMEAVAAASALLTSEAGKAADTFRAGHDGVGDHAP
jgi:hypothetical protein